MSLNKLRDMYAAGVPAVGTFLSSGNQSVMECLGYAGLDYAIIDTEHGSFDTESMMDLIRAAERVDVVPVVRIADVTHKEIQRAADCGAQAIIIPCLRDVEDFKKAVDFAKFTPIGNRGFIKGRGAGFGNLDWSSGSLEEFFSNSNERLILMPQCETVEALEHIDEIVEIEGVDAIFIGPFDLSIAMGMPGQFDDPAFKAACDKVLGACKRAGKPCYTLSMKTDQALQQIGEGYAGVAHNLDFNVLTEAYRKIVTEIKENL